MSPKLAVRVGWPPELVLKLLQAISEDSAALQTYFPISSTQALGKLKQSKKFCALFFKNDQYMIEIERLGYAKRALEEDDWNIEEWLKIDSKDTVYDKVVLLKRHLRSGKFKEDNGIRDEWRSFDDIPDRKERDELLKKIPYYFLLKRLCNPDGDQNHSQPLILTRPPASTNTIRSERRQRSLSVISISSSGSASSASDAPSSPEEITESEDNSQNGFTGSESPDSPLHSPSSDSNHETCSSDVEEVQLPSIFAKASKTRRSVIKNTWPDQACAIPHGPGRGVQDAIDVDDHQHTVDHQESTEEEKPHVTEFVDELGSNPSSEAILSFVICNGALDQDKLRSTAVASLEREMEKGGLARDLLNPTIKSWVVGQQSTKRTRKNILERARMELGLEAIQRTIDSGLRSRPIEGYGIHFNLMPLGDHVARDLVRLIVLAGGVILDSPRDRKSRDCTTLYRLVWQKEDANAHQGKGLLAKGMNVCLVNTWILRFFSMCKNMENEHYQIEERVDYLVVDSQNEKRAAGTGTLVFVDPPISKLFKKNLRKLAKYNGLPIEP
ncbi:hypothetical protein I203_105117 [Kwoniella mangroviensis CBS 8507]|uniref:uncharacterized protein n=1 Tax=Kwoniella mangroviensis CBS 8507 TaxID=1296122 RepID=UPI00080D611F|nr:uncharacterized protein I203_00941 [Kwoniella mangroviensis CBS 8507]OCF69090.1 hypothetical protein I203_00941 [Kwoniella mangroviensis CBS 8507]